MKSSYKLLDLIDKNIEDIMQSTQDLVDAINLSDANIDDKKFSRSLAVHVNFELTSLYSKIGSTLSKNHYEDKLTLDKYLKSLDAYSHGIEKLNEKVRKQIMHEYYRGIDPEREAKPGYSMDKLPSMLKQDEEKIHRYARSLGDKSKIKQSMNQVLIDVMQDLAQRRLYYIDTSDSGTSKDLIMDKKNFCKYNEKIAESINKNLNAIKHAYGEMKKHYESRKYKNGSQIKNILYYQSNQPSYKTA